MDFQKFPFHLRPTIRSELQMLIFLLQKKFSMYVSSVYATYLPCSYNLHEIRHLIVIIAYRQCLQNIYFSKNFFNFYFISMEQFDII